MTTDLKPGLKLENPEWYEPKRWLYWMDFLASTALGYGLWATAWYASNPWLSTALLLTAVPALYRAAFFMHEIVHQGGNWKAFKWTWNCLVGIPLGVPSFFNELVHDEHHQVGNFGTAGDPQYRPLSLTGFPVLLQYFGTAFWGPLVPVIRYLLLFPISLAFPRFRETVETRFSVATMMRPDYQRHGLDAGEKRELLRVELIGFGIWSLVLAVISLRGLPLKLGAEWCVISGGLILFHQLRTCIAHLYLRPLDSRPSTLAQQAADSIDISGGVLASLVAPLGSRYHGTHHLFPEVPYHRLGRLHLHLRDSAARERLGVPKVTVYPSFTHALLALLRRVESRRPRGLPVGSRSRAAS
jgi:fatty acid desaturase